MTEMTSIQPGRYRHYKGNEYTVVGTGRHNVEAIACLNKGPGWEP